MLNNIFNQKKAVIWGDLKTIIWMVITIAVVLVIIVIVSKNIFSGGLPSIKLF